MSEERLTPQAQLRELSHSECLHLLRTERPAVGRVAFVDGEYPVVLPVNYVMRDDDVLFRTGAGTKLTAVLAGAPVAFQCDHLVSAWQEGWSVLVRGWAEEVTDEGELATITQLPLHPWAPGEKSHVVRIVPRHVSGRRIV